MLYVPMDAHTHGVTAVLAALSVRVGPGDAGPFVCGVRGARP